MGTTAEIGGKIKALALTVNRINVVFGGETPESRHKKRVRVNIEEHTHIYQTF